VRHAGHAAARGHIRSVLRGNQKHADSKQDLLAAVLQRPLSEMKPDLLMPLANRRRTAVLASALVLAAAAYTGLVGAHRTLLERDYSSISDPVARMGYCMASSLFHGEKSTIAESLARPSDPDLFRRVMPRIMSGQVTTDKVLAGRALFERDERRERSDRILSRVATHCGLEAVLAGRALFERDERRERSDRILSRVATHCGLEAEHRAQREEILKLAVAWLQRDLAFLSMHAQSQARLPDAAERFASVGSGT
jgi:hypothetical protein